MASYIPNIRTDNISLYLIPFHFVISLFPRIWAAGVYKSKTKDDYSTIAPRQIVQQIDENKALDAKLKACLRRAEAASLNGFENFGVFAAAITAGNAAGLDPAVLNGTTIAYLASRVLYNYLYISNETAGQAGARSLTYIGGLGLLFSLFIQAGTKFKNAVVL